MVQRQQLHDLLKVIVDNVYFQPPPSHTMTYPCVVYSVDNAKTVFADNSPYRFNKRYMITVIDRNPDSELPDKVAVMPMCVFNREYVANNLNHTVFVLYF